MGFLAENELRILSSCGKSKRREPFAADGAVVLAHGLVQLDACPLAGGELGGAHEAQVAHFGSLLRLDDHSIAQLEVDVGHSGNHAAIWRCH